MRQHTRVIFYLIAAAFLVSHANAEWEVDTRANAKIWQAKLVKRRTLEWSGGVNAEGQAEGRGVLTVYYDGKVVATYHGQMQSGRIDGYVVANYLKTQQRYEGELRDWNEEGLGTMYYPDGRTESGIWSNAKFVEAKSVLPAQQNEPSKSDSSVVEKVALPTEPVAIDQNTIPRGIAVTPISDLKPPIDEPSAGTNLVKEQESSVLQGVMGSNTTASDDSEKSLEDLLKLESGPWVKTDPEKHPSWIDLLSALERQDFQAALVAAQDAEMTKDFLEPLQRTYASAVTEILAPRGTVTDGGTSLVVKQRMFIEEAKSEIPTLEEEILVIESKRPAIKKRTAANETGALIAGLFVKDLGDSIASSNIENAERELEELDRQIAVREQQINAATQRVQQAEENIKRIKSEENLAAVDRDKEQLARVVRLLEQLKERGQYRPTVLLATAYTRSNRADIAINQIAQECIDLLKKQKRAHEIATAALKPIKAAIDNRRFWTAKEELTRAKSLIEQRITDESLLDLISIEIASVDSDIDAQITKVEMLRATNMEFALRDAPEGAKRLREFQTLYPDYPNKDRDELQIQDLWNNQVQSRSDKTLAAINEVIPNDPAEAKLMISRLVAEETNPDDISVIKSKVTALNAKIWERQLEMLQDRIDQVYSYLELYNAAYAKSIASGQDPSFSMPLRIDNLQQAQALQIGILKEIELLLAEEQLPSSLKRRIMGLQESQKASLVQIEHTLWINKITMIAIVCGITVLVLASIIFYFSFVRLKQQRRNQAISQPPSVESDDASSI